MTGALYAAMVQWDRTNAPEDRQRVLELIQEGGHLTDGELKRLIPRPRPTSRYHHPGGELA